MNSSTTVQQSVVQTVSSTSSGCCTAVYTWEANTIESNYIIINTCSCNLYDSRVLHLVMVMLLVHSCDADNGERVRLRHDVGALETLEQQTDAKQQNTQS